MRDMTLLQMRLELPNDIAMRADRERTARRK
jgi:hypothetical protein